MGQLTISKTVRNVFHNMHSYTMQHGYAADYRHDTTINDRVIDKIQLLSNGTGILHIVLIHHLWKTLVIFY